MNFFIDSNIIIEALKGNRKAIEIFSILEEEKKPNSN